MEVLPKMKRLHRVLFITLIGVLLISSTVLAAENLVANPSFEEGEAEGWPVGYAGFQALKSYGDGAMLVKDFARTGSWSLKFYNPSEDVALGLVSLPVSAEAGKTYKASAYVLTEPGSGKASLYIEFLNEKKARVSATWVQSQSTDTWELLEITEKAPEGTAYVGLIIYRPKTQKGVHYYDDLSIVVVQ
jgi:hypothetical protein